MKNNLQLTALAVAFGCVSAFAQSGKLHTKGGVAAKIAANNGPAENTAHYPNRGCGTGVPSDVWEQQFQKQIAEFLKNQTNANGKAEMINYTIPVIIHVIHGGQPAGTYPNLAQGQLNSQITVLNADYGGTGLNVGNYPATAFQAYASSSVALSASLSAANKDGLNRVAIANTNVQFCLATKDSLGNTLVEPGIERISYISKGWANPTSFGSIATFQNFIDNTVKPQTIWNVRKYLNMWVTDENIGAVGLLGYATFPVATGLAGLGAPFGSSTTDGFWAYARCIGSNVIFPGGVYDPTYNKGRTCTHEIGHWLGLRHVWGDGGVRCGATDYCVDTPPQYGTTGPPAGCYYGNPVYPANANLCTRPDGTAGASVKNLNGDMFMNFMDYTDDPSMYMFTTDQRTRIQTAMANSPYRNQLGLAGLCTAGAATPAVSAFNMTTTACKNAAVSVTNTSTGNPTPTFTWSSNPLGASYNPNANATNPLITFTANGTYTVSLAASNPTLSTSTKVITISTCTTATPCNDTLTNFKNTDTLMALLSGTANPGYVAGNNGYGDLAKAEWYSSTGLVGNSKIVGGIILFYRHQTATIGTHGASNMVISVYNGTNVGGGGPTGASLGNYTVSPNTAIAVTPTTGVTYCGNPGLAFTNAIIRPFSFNFATAINIGADFLMSVKLPTVAGDTAAIFMTSGKTAAVSTAWEQWSDLSWNQFNDGTANSWQLNSSIAVLPKIACILGVYNPNGISGNIAVFPNPSNGIFNFAVTMPQPSDLNITVTNQLGQQVYSKIERNIGNAIIGLDLSHLAKGIYFANIIDSSGDKVTKKIIIE